MRPLLFMHFPVIHPETGSLFFNRFYLLAFFIAILSGFLFGYYKKVSLRQVLLSFTLFVLFFIIGNKLFALSTEDWQRLFTYGQWPVHMRKTMLGGITGLLAGIVIYESVMRNSRRMLDLVALILPAGMAIQRIGCLLAGCCSGTPTGLPWGIRYSQYSHAWESQLHSGLIDRSCVESLPVHPTQIYDLLSCLLIILIIIKAGKYLKATGNLLLLSVALYVTARFLIDFARDPLQDFLPGKFIGIKYVQWITLAGAVLIFTIIIILEKRNGSIARISEPSPERFSRVFLLSLSSFVLFFWMKPWFDMSEKIVLLSLLIPLLVMNSIMLFRRMTIPGLRLATACLTGGMVILMGQSYIPEEPNEKVKYIEITAGGAIGSFNSIYRAMHKHTYYDPGGCGTPGHWESYFTYGESRNYSHKAYLGSIDIMAKQNITKDQRLTFGVGITAGPVCNSVADTNATSANFNFVINPAFSYDWRGIGLKFGLYVGDFYFINQYKDENPENDYVIGNTGSLKKFYVFLQSSVRIGPYDIAFVEAKLADHFPQGNPVLPLSIGVGTGLGRLDGRRISAGYSSSGYFADCYFPIRDKIVVQGGMASNFRSGTDNAFSVFIGVGCRFNYKTVIKKSHQDAKQTKNKSN